MGFVCVSIEYKQGTQITSPHSSQTGEDQAEQSNETAEKKCHQINPDSSFGEKPLMVVCYGNPYQQNTSKET